MPTHALVLPPFRRAIDLIVVHCSATASGKWLGGKSPDKPGYVTAPRIIDGWHAKRGFIRSAAARTAYNYRLSSIGYHWLIDIDGHVWTGRHPDEIGAHAAGHNAASLGICLVGGVEREGRYTPAQWSSLAALITELRARLGTPRICGHRDLSPDIDGDGRVETHEWLKTCPGFHVAAYLQSLVPLPQHVFNEGQP